MSPKDSPDANSLDAMAEVIERGLGIMAEAPKELIAYGPVVRETRDSGLWFRVLPPNRVKTSMDNAPLVIGR